MIKKLRMPRLLLMSTLFVLLVFSSCVKNNPLPVYLDIAEWELEANAALSGKEGELYHNFRHAAVYVGDEILGYFELPCRIPVLKTGNQRITVSPVIMNGGRMKVKTVYPFTEFFYLDAELISGQTIQINPKTRYSSSVVFKFVEDFESASLKILTDPASNASLFQTQHTDAGRSGYKGEINLSASDSLWLGYSFSDLVLPKGGAQVFLEIDCRNTAYMSTGVLSINSLNENTVHPNIGINPSTTWRRIYIEWNDIVSYSDDSQFFETYLKTALPTGSSTGKVEIDNIKVIHF